MMVLVVEREEGETSSPRILPHPTHSFEWNILRHKHTHQDMNHNHTQRYFLSFRMNLRFDTHALLVFSLSPLFQCLFLGKDMFFTQLHSILFIPFRPQQEKHYRLLNQHKYLCYWMFYFLSLLLLLLLESSHPSIQITDHEKDQEIKWQVESGNLSEETFGSLFTFLFLL